MGFCAKHLLVTDGLSSTICKIMMPQYSEKLMTAFHQIFKGKILFWDPDFFLLHCCP